MYQFNNPLELYKHLPKSNCRQCQEPTCLAFAAAVIQGKKQLGKCPHLNKSIIEKAAVVTNKPVSLEQYQAQLLSQLKKEVAAVDFASAADRLGAALMGGKLAIKVLGRDFFVNQSGQVTSACHVNPWVVVPLLKYVISSPGKSVTGNWVPFRELKNGMTWLPLYEQRCEKPLKKIADNHEELFADLLGIFGGKPAPGKFAGSLAMVLSPLPRVPMLISYQPKEEFDSRLNIFFDRSVDENLNIESLYLLGAGLVIMLEKITQRHGNIN